MLTISLPDSIKLFLFAHAIKFQNIFLFINAAFTFSDFDNQERNLTFVKTVFQVLKLKLFGCDIKHAFYLLH